MNISFLILSLLIIADISQNNIQAMNNPLNIKFFDPEEGDVEDNVPEDTSSKDPEQEQREEINNINKQLDNYNATINNNLDLSYDALLNILDNLKEINDYITNFSLEIYRKEINYLLSKIKNIDNLVSKKIKKYQIDNE